MGLMATLPDLPSLQAGFEPLTERARNLTEVAMVRLLLQGLANSWSGSSVLQLRPAGVSTCAVVHMLCYNQQPTA